MDLSKRIGVTFLIFTSFTLAMNLMFRDNPDFWLNVTMESVLVVMFAISIIAKHPYSGGIQIACLVVASAFSPPTPGGPFFSSAISIFALILIYAYGGYREMKWPKIAISFAFLYSIMVLNLSRTEPFNEQIFIRGFVWSMFLVVFCFVLWLVVEEIDTRFHRVKESELLRINRELIKLNHELLDGGCNDATGKS